MEQVAVFYRFDRLIDIKECNVRERSGERNASGAPGHIDQAGVL